MALEDVKHFRLQEVQAACGNLCYVHTDVGGAITVRYPWEGEVLVAFEAPNLSEAHEWILLAKQAGDRWQTWADANR